MERGAISTLISTCHTPVSTFLSVLQYHRTHPFLNQSNNVKAFFSNCSVALAAKNAVNWIFYAVTDQALLALETLTRLLGLLQFNCMKIDSFKLKWISWTSWTQKTTSEYRIGWDDVVALEGIIFRHALKFTRVNFETICKPSQRWRKEWMSKRDCDEATWIWWESITCQKNNCHLSIQQLLQR